MDEEWQAAAKATQESIESLLAARDAAQGWGEAIESAVLITDSADQLLRVTIQSARAEGATWQTIGDALGVTRQAAFQRYGKPRDPEPESR